MAAMPMRGASRVEPNTKKAPSTPPPHSHQAMRGRPASEWKGWPVATQVIARATVPTAKEIHAASREPLPSVCRSELFMADCRGITSPMTKAMSSSSRTIQAPRREAPMVPQSPVRLA